MKRSYITEKIMNKVIIYEENKSRNWLRRFMVILLVLVISVLLFMILFVKEMNYNKTFDLLSLFTEDKEIIDQFWQDTLSVFLMEIPQNYALLGLIGLISLIVLVIIGRKKLKLVKKKLGQVEKYLQKASQRRYL